MKILATTWQEHRCASDISRIVEWYKRETYEGAYDWLYQGCKRDDGERLVKDLAAMGIEAMVVRNDGRHKTNIMSGLILAIRVGTPSWEIPSLERRSWIRRFIGMCKK